MIFNILNNFQATNENIREFQEAVQKITTEEIANFTSGRFGCLIIQFADSVRAGFTIRQTRQSA